MGVRVRLGVMIAPRFRVTLAQQSPTCTTRLRDVYFNECFYTSDLMEASFMARRRALARVPTCLEYEVIIITLLLVLIGSLI